LPFDEALRVWEDWDLLLRIAAQHDVRYLSQVLVISHDSVDSLTRNLPARADALLRLRATHEATIRNDRTFHARLLYLEGRYRYLSGGMVQARSAVTQALRIKVSLKPLGLLMLVMAGPAGRRIFDRLAGFARWLR
jgi:hypothetical protein